MTAAAASAPSIAARLTGARVGARRTTVDRVMRSLALIASLLCAVPLIAVLVFVTANGLSALSLDLITKPPKALGIGGGAANAVVGTLQMVPLAALIAVPSGVLAAIYVGEFAERRSARVVRFCADVLVGVPSILIGIFVFTFLVLPFKQFNGFAGSVALAVIMVPVVMRTTEESLNLVPSACRCGGPCSRSSCAPGCPGS
jgi:phosphate transport system permease protein